MKKELREKIFHKCDGHCAYCGKEITYKEMQVDHIEPKWHTFTEQEADKHKIIKGSDDFENLNPSCPRCNKWKSTYSLEHFRKVVRTSLVRLERDTPNYRLAKDYGLIVENDSPIVFYFEKNNISLSYE